MISIQNMKINGNKSKKNRLALYIHIPFCKHICSYCDFPKLLSDKKFISNYLVSLIKEIDTLPKVELKTIYFGGGTPLSLSIDELKLVLNKLKTMFDLNGLEEFCFETTIEEISEEKIALLKSYHVNRLSIGIQTFLNLPYLNRIEKYETIKEKTKILNDLDFNNYNFDLIYGWPSQTLSQFKDDLNKILSLNPKHISLYPLAIEENTLLYNQGIKPISDDEYADFYNFAVDYLKSQGYYRYEISNFAKKGYESKHNLCYWKSEDYLAVGLGATSFYEGKRIRRTRSITKYIQGEYNLSLEIEDEQDMKNDFVMLNLRLDKGFTFEDYNQRFDSDFLKDYEKNIAKIKTYIEIDDKSIKIKDDYRYILDSILVELLI